MKTQMSLNKVVYLGSLIIDLSKTVMHEFWYDYVKPKYGKNIKTEDICKDIAEDVELKIESKVNYLQKNKIDLDILKEDQKESIKT